MSDHTNPKPRVLFVSGSYPPINCGIGYYMARLCKALEAEGYEDFSILTSQDVDHDAHVLPWVNKWSFSAWPQVVRAIKQVEPELVHIQYSSVRYGRRPFISLLPHLLKLRYPKLKLIVTLHEYHDASSLGRRREDVLIAPIREVIVSNDEDRRMLKAKFGKKKIEQIPIGPMVDIAKMSGDTKTKLAKRYNPKHKTLLMSWGIIDAAKGTDQLVLAMGNLPDCKLVIVGEYDESVAFHRELKALIDASSADIEWVGYLDNHDTSQLLQICDLVVLPYTQPVSLRRSTVLSSLLHGKPIVTTGPASTPLKHRDNCYLIDSNDPDSLVNAIEELRNDPKLSRMLGERAAKLAADFNWESIARKHVELYKKISGQHT